MLSAIIVLGALGLIFGGGLAIASKKFAIERDPRLDEVLEALPGANCGACGNPGCAGYAEVIAKGGPINKCPVGGLKVAEQLAEIMGLTSDITIVKAVSRLRCSGTCSAAPKVIDYRGIKDCSAAGLYGGDKGCTFGCLGYGNCERACPYGAIRIADDGLPKIDEELCTACARCVSACPRELLHIVRYDRPVMVACLSRDKGPEVRKVCSSGCIACGICVKQCQFDAIKVENFLAVIDPEKCTSCGRCAEKCPTKAITGVK